MAVDLISSRLLEAFESAEAESQDAQDEELIERIALERLAAVSVPYSIAYTIEEDTAA